MLRQDFSPNLNEGKMVMVPFCGEKECEERMKDCAGGPHPRAAVCGAS